MTDIHCLATDTFFNLKDKKHRIDARAHVIMFNTQALTRRGRDFTRKVWLYKTMCKCGRVFTTKPWYVMRNCRKCRKSYSPK